MIRPDRKFRESWQVLGALGESYNIGVVKIAREYFIYDMSTEVERMVFRGTDYNTFHSEFYKLLTIKKNKTFIDMELGGNIW